MAAKTEVLRIDMVVNGGILPTVTTIDSSCTDDEYPTAKAVWDLFASITDADSKKY